MARFAIAFTLSCTRVQGARGWAAWIRETRMGTSPVDVIINVRLIWSSYTLHNMYRMALFVFWVHLQKT